MTKSEIIILSQKEIIEQQAKEIERLKSELSHWTFERFKQLEANNHALREALEYIEEKSGFFSREHMMLISLKAQAALQEES